MKIKSYLEFERKMAEAERLEAKIKTGEAIYREETKFLKLIKELREFAAYVIISRQKSINP